MSTKKVLKLSSLGLIVLLVGIGVSLTAWYVYALAVSAEKRQVLRSETLKIAGGEQKFKAFYLSAPAEEFHIMFNVSEGSIRFSPWQAIMFEDSLGYFDYHNGTGVEKRQVWFFEGNNGTAGCSIDPAKDVDQVWYILFYNEDSFEKEVSFQVVKVWHGLF